ncbi:class I SAM-dependent methyltransferase [Candidatus Gottesmanbacteria bacterium]|nr:class I SAM-dependent methyltransferase [Candidatus Gottesmanbacteria bacterium]
MINKCKLCFSQHTKIIRKYNNYYLIRCKRCGVVFIYPQPRRIRIAQNNLSLYDSKQSEKAYFYKREELIRRAKENIKILKKYEKIGKLLDIGCSYGFYSKVFKDYHYDVTGIDISERAIKYAKNYFKLNAIIGNFEKHKNRYNYYDVITMFDIIEHFHNPQQIIRKVHQLLKNKGIVIIQTPNMDSLLEKLCRTKWFWLLVPQHLFLFNKPSLSRILTENGFKILNTSSWDDLTEFIKNILFVIGLKDKGKTKFVYYFLYILMKPLSFLSYFWSIFGYGGEITIYAQKIK